MRNLLDTLYVMVASGVIAFMHSRLSGPSIFPFGRRGTAATPEGVETIVVVVEEGL